MDRPKVPAKIAWFLCNITNKISTKVLCMRWNKVLGNREYYFRNLNNQEGTKMSKNDYNQNNQNNQSQENKAGQNCQNSQKNSSSNSSNNSSKKNNEY